jgi:hypothetical protein
VNAYRHCCSSSRGTSHPLERIVAILNVLRELYGREFPVVHRDHNHISATAYGTATVVLSVEISRHKATARKEYDNRTRTGRCLVLRRLIDADCHMVGDLFVIYVIKISSNGNTDVRARTFVHAVTPCGGGGKVLALLTMREQKASPRPGPDGSSGPEGSEFSY